MKRYVLTLCLAAAIVAAGGAAAARADQTPFPNPKITQVFIAAQTVTGDGTAASWFWPGSSVVFRAYAVDMKTKKIVTKQDVKYFYVTIPNAGSVTLRWNPSAPGASKGIPWSGLWVVPANYPNGVVNFTVHVRLNSKAVGTFTQIPVASSQLNISSTAPMPASSATSAGTPNSAASGAQSLSLYVDSINGTAPAGVAARPIGCTQTNVYHRGERVVIRSWGADLANGNVLSTDNVQEAHYSIPGQTDIPLTWGLHGATGAKVYFWSNYWIVPSTFPLGETTVHVVFTMLNGKSGTFDYPITIIP